MTTKWITRLDKSYFKKRRRSASAASSLSGSRSVSTASAEAEGILSRKLMTAVSMMYVVAEAEDLHDNDNCLT